MNEPLRKSLAIVGLGQLGTFLLERWALDETIDLVGVWTDNAKSTSLTRTLSVPVVEHLADLAAAEAVFLEEPLVENQAEKLLAMGLDLVLASAPAIGLEAAQRLWHHAAECGRRIIIAPVPGPRPDFCAAQTALAANRDAPPRVMRFEQWTANVDGTIPPISLPRAAIAECVRLAAVEAQWASAARIGEMGLSARIDFPDGLVAELSVHASAVVQRPPRWIIEGSVWGYADSRLWRRRSDGELFEIAAEPGEAPTIEERIRTASDDDGLTALWEIALREAIEKALTAHQVIPVESVTPMLHPSIPSQSEATRLGTSIPSIADG